MPSGRSGRRCGAAPLHSGIGVKKTFTIAELAEAFGITPRAIRFYEDRGLLSPQRIGQ